MHRLLTRRVRRLGLTSKVTWLNRLDAQTIVRELQACTTSVVPSRVDNSPNSLAEALIRGVACVASNAGGITSMVEDGVDGLLFESGDAESLAAALRRILGDDALRRSLGRAARERALKRHDPGAICEATLRCYESILARERPSLPAQR